MSRQRNPKSIFHAMVVLGLILAIALSANACQFSMNDIKTEKELLLAEKESQISGLIDKVDEYAAMGGEFTGFKDAVKPCKIFIVQNNFTPGAEQPSDDEYIYSPIYFMLPEVLQAKSPDELNTLVQLNIFEVATGKYTNGANAYTLHTKMTIIDTTKNEVIFYTDIIQEPFTNITNDSQLHREIPKHEIIFRLEDLAGHTQLEIKEQNHTISAGYKHTLGLKTDGTVVAAGNNENGQCEVSTWTGIVAVFAGDMNSFGLKEDGTLVVAGKPDEFDEYGQCDVSLWTDIRSVSAERYHTVGLKTDGA
ncbi:MAG: RCC1 domain-containing protein, partial [Clostridia bacterium]